jgi:opacity protein-like surface antigen
MTLRSLFALAALSALPCISSLAHAQSTTEEGRSESFLDKTHLGGYGEVTFADPNGSEPARLDIQRFVIYIDHYFSPAWAVKSETEIEHVKVEGGVGGEVALEQAFLDWHGSDAFGWRVGLMLIPMGIINQTHEPNTFYSVQRPIVDEKVIPSTWREIGTGIYGQLAEGLRYQAYLTEGLRGEGIGIEGMHDAKQEGSSDEGEGSNASHPAISAKLDYAPLAGLKIGGGTYIQPSAFTSAPEGISGMLLCLSGDASYQVGGLRLRGEYATWHIGDADSISHTSAEAIPNSISGGYVEAGYNILSSINPETSAELVPFARFESISIKPHDLEVQTETYVTGGLAYKPLDNVILKLDYLFSNSEIVTEKGKLNLGAGFSF